MMEASASSKIITRVRSKKVLDNQAYASIYNSYTFMTREQNHKPTKDKQIYEWVAKTPAFLKEWFRECTV